MLPVWLIVYAKGEVIKQFCLVSSFLCKKYLVLSKLLNVRSCISIVYFWWQSTTPAYKNCELLTPILALAILMSILKYVSSISKLVSILIYCQQYYVFSHCWSNWFFTLFSGISFACIFLNCFFDHQSSAIYCLD